MGKGVSSTVYKGKYRGQDVAIKLLRLENAERDLKDFKEELHILK